MAVVYRKLSPGVKRSVTWESASRDTMRFVVILCLVETVSTAHLKGLRLGTRSEAPHSSPQSLPKAGVSHFLKVLDTPPHTPDLLCDLYCCNCAGDRALCTGQDRRTVNYLPRLPAKIRDFRMMRAHLRNLTQSMMANLSNFDIVKMTLKSNNISHIEADAFTDFPKLELLDLSGNPIPMPELHAALRGISSTSMNTVALGAMELASLPDDFFDVFFNKTFKKVDLQGNRLKTLNNVLFAPFSEVDFIDISHNALSDVNVTARVNVRRLKLKHNLFRQFPDLCLHRSPETRETGYFRAFHNLQIFFIADNPLIQIHPSALRGTCLPSLKKLDISRSVTLTFLENNFIADLPKLQIIMVNEMTALTRYGRYAFNSSSLKVLSLNENRRWDKRAVDVQHVFNYCPNLERLTLVGTKISMQTNELRVLLLQLKSVKWLNLGHVSLRTIPEDMLWRLPKLQTLLLAGNHLHSDNLARALINVTQLKQLNLHANRITVVNETTFPWEFRRTVTVLDISHNPFSCTCDLLWFRRWLDDVHRNKTVTIHNFPSAQYRCNEPAAVKEVHLADFHPTEEKCVSRNHVSLVSVIVNGCLLAGLLGVSVYIFRYRRRLRLFVERLRRRRLYEKTPELSMHECSDSEVDWTPLAWMHEEGQQDIQKPQVPYDVYVAHSTADSDWVVQELLPFLEGELGLKVFVEERDSIPGTCVFDSIPRHMEQSAKVLLLLSDSYNMEWEFRHQEFQTIVLATIEQQRKDVIVLLLGDIEAGSVTKHMREILTRGTFLQWGEGEKAKRMFRKGLKMALTT